MTPEAFLEICEQHYGTSNPGFIETVKKLQAGQLNTDETFEEYFEGLKQKRS